MQLAQEQLDANSSTVAELKQLIREKHANALKMLDDPHCIVAVNHTVVSSDTTALRAGDEVAFYPPVTGG